MSNTKYPQRDLFVSNELLDLEEESEKEINFPLFFKNESETRYIRYDENERFECVTINKKNESIRACLMYGFDETIRQVRGDKKLWYYLLIKNNTKITAEEYEQKFSEFLESRERFFTQIEIDEYVMPVVENQPVSKHKWKQIDF